MRNLKILAWILFFPFMLTYWAWKNDKKPLMVLGLVLSVILLQTVLFGSDQAYTENDPLLAQTSEAFDPFEGYRILEVDGGDLSGDREANVVVDIGFGDREYYAFTNEYGQLVKVIADEIILQDDENEPVLSTGRYFRDEAKVPGVESKVLDEGHVIADSLGGVSNAYNITPQNSTLNRHGDQAYMEDQIREAGGCTNFVAIITYPDTETQIPSHYDFTYTLKGKVIHDEFDNVNPDEVNKKLVDQDTSTGIRIKALDKRAEYIIIENAGAEDLDLDGWTIVSERGSQSYEFEEYVLKVNSQVKIGGYDAKSEVDLLWEEGSGVWSNSKSDPASLYNEDGTLVSRYED